MTYAHLLDEVAACWAAAQLSPEREVHDLSIAGQDVRLVLVGERLAALVLDALGAPPPSRGAPPVEIGAWDAAATGVPLPPRPPGVDGQRWTATRDGQAVVEVGLQRNGSIRTADRDSKRYLVGVPDAARLSTLERGSPLRHQLLWATWPAVQLVHAAAVATDRGVALLVGSSGAGKSSTALACAADGMALLGDDYCAVTPGAPPEVHLLHTSARLFDDELAHAPAALAATATPDQDKVVVWPERTGVAMPRSGPLRVVIVLERGAGPSPVRERIRASTALRRFAPSMLHQQHVDPAGELAGLRRLLESVPVERLTLGTDRRANPPVIARTIEEPGGLS
jgi:hypothetical protein